MVNANSVSEAALIAALRPRAAHVHLGLRLTVPETWGGQFGLSSTRGRRRCCPGALDDPWVDLCGFTSIAA